MRYFTSAFLLIFFFANSYTFAKRPVHTIPGESYNDNIKFEEIQNKKEKEKEKKINTVIKALNQLNVISDDFKDNSGVFPEKDIYQQDNPYDSLSTQLDKFQVIFSNPMFQSYMKVISDKKFIEDLRKLLSHKNLSILVFLEIVFFIFMLFFKAWRQSQASHWARIVLVNLWTSLLYIAVAFFILPGITLGSGFLQLIKAALSVI